VPLAVHIGYVLATYSHLPPMIGRVSGTQTELFLGTWLGIVTLANGAFVFLLVRLPHFGSRMLKVPGQRYWLATGERKDELVSRLRGICEIALFGLNVFFIAVYQAIYQGNTLHPYLFIPFSVLVFFFMGLPLFSTVVYMVIAIRGLATKARSHTGN
jgi:hypothetical protein